MISRATAISILMVPAVYTNREGFISGEATTKATKGAAGTPMFIRRPATGMAAKVHRGEIRASRVDATMEPLARCWSARRIRVLGK